MATPGSTAVQTQINALGERFDRGIGEIKTMLVGFDERLRSLENREAGCQPMVSSRLDAAWRRLDEHDKSFKELTNLIGVLTKDQIGMTNQVKTLQSILLWALGLATPVLLGLIIALATGKAQIVFK